MVSGVVVVTIGLPASGKTTLCNQLVKRFLDWYIFHVCYDKIIDDRGDWQSPDFTWRTARTNVVKCVENLLLHLLEIRQSETDVDREAYEKFSQIVVNDQPTDKSKNFVLLIDDNMYYRSMRYTYYQLARKYRLGFVQINLKGSLEAILGRNSARSQSEMVPELIIHRMSERLEIPDENNDWEKLTETVSIDEDFDVISFKLHNILIKAINEPPPLLPDEEEMNEVKTKSKLETNESNLHQADLILRKTIAEIRKYCADENVDNINEICLRLGRSKNDIMSKLRSNVLDINLARKHTEMKRLLVDSAELSDIISYDWMQNF